MVVTESMPILGGSSPANANGYGHHDSVYETRRSSTDSTQHLIDKTNKSEQEDKSFWNIPSIKKWTFVLFSLANVAYSASFSLLAPFFPDEAAAKGMPQGVMGLVFSCYELWPFLLSPLYGNYMTQIGARFAFIAGQFMTGGCSILFGTLYMAPAGVPFTVLTFLLRSMMALGAAAFCTASYAMAAEKFPDHRSMVLATLEVCSGVGFMMGPPLGGLLYELGGFGLPFYSMGSFMIVWSIINYFSLPVAADNVQKPVQRWSVFSLLASPLIVVCCLALMCGSYTFGFMDVSLALHLQQFHVEVATSGLYFMVFSLIYSAVSLLVGWLSSDKNFSYPLMVIGGVLVIISMLLIGPSPLLSFLTGDLWLITVALVLTGCGNAALIIPVFRCFYIGARRLGLQDGLEMEAVLSGLFTSAYHLGAFLGPTIGSSLTQAMNFEWSATINAGFVLLSLTLLVIYIVVEKFCLKYDDIETFSPKSSQDTPQSSPIPGQTSPNNNHDKSPSVIILSDSSETEF